LVVFVSVSILAAYAEVAKMWHGDVLKAKLLERQAPRQGAGPLATFDGEVARAAEHAGELLRTLAVWWFGRVVVNYYTPGLFWNNDPAEEAAYRGQSPHRWLWRTGSGLTGEGPVELEFEQAQTKMAQKPVLRVKWARVCVARMWPNERGGVGEHG
jgi:hypothetical protein